MERDKRYRYYQEPDHTQQQNRSILWIGYLLIGLIIVLGTLNVSELGHTTALFNWTYCPTK